MELAKVCDKLEHFPQASSAVAALRRLAQLKADIDQIAAQRDADEQQWREADPEEMAELRRIYQGELEDANSRYDLGHQLLEQELTAFLRRHSGGDKKLERRKDLLEVLMGGRGAVLEISPGVGGLEAALFARELLDMYERLASAKGWSFEVEHMAQEGEALQSATVRIAGRSGDNSPFSWLFAESGLHRVQRVPITDKKGRMQTSGAVVVILPIAEEGDVSLNDKDIRVDIMKKSSGPGGQSVNASFQAVRATYIPTGLSVRVDSSQSQLENKIKALEMLRTRVLAQRMASRVAAEKKDRQEQKGTGDRSEKIRTYNFQRDEVVDHQLSKDEGGAGHGANDVLYGEGLEALLQAHQLQARSLLFNRAVDVLEAQIAEKTPASDKNTS